MLGNKMSFCELRVANGKFWWIFKVCILKEMGTHIIHF